MLPSLNQGMSSMRNQSTADGRFDPSYCYTKQGDEGNEEGEVKRTPRPYRICSLRTPAKTASAKGHLAAMFENGHIVALLRRLRELKKGKVQKET
jgi:hypothetical protein